MQGVPNKALVEKFVLTGTRQLIYHMKKHGYYEKRLEMRAKNRHEKAQEHIEETIAEIAARQASSLARTQRIVDTMLRDLEECIETVEAAKKSGKKALVKRPAFLGERESVADFVKKLGEVQIRTIQMERSVLGMDGDEQDEKRLYEEKLRKLYELPDFTNKESPNVIDGEFRQVDSPRVASK